MPREKGQITPTPTPQILTLGKQFYIFIHML